MEAITRLRWTGDMLRSGWFRNSNCEGLRERNYGEQLRDDHQESC